MGILLLETQINYKLYRCNKVDISKKMLMEHFTPTSNYMVPKRYYVVSSKPTNKNKLDRVALKAMSIVLMFSVRLINARKITDFASVIF